MRNLQKKGILQKCSGESVKTGENFTKNEGEKQHSRSGRRARPGVKKTDMYEFKNSESKKIYFLDSAASAASVCAALSRSS